MEQEHTIELKITHGDRVVFERRLVTWNPIRFLDHASLTAMITRLEHEQEHRCAVSVSELARFKQEVAKDKWFSESARCCICCEDLGWACAYSADGSCKYADHGENCIFCGMPEERK